MFDLEISLSWKVLSRPSWSLPVGPECSSWIKWLMWGWKTILCIYCAIYISMRERWGWSGAKCAQSHLWKVETGFTWWHVLIPGCCVLILIHEIKLFSCLNFLKMNATAAEPAEGSKPAPPEFKQKGSRQFKSKAPKPGQKEWVEWLFTLIHQFLVLSLNTFHLLFQ